MLWQVQGRWSEEMGAFRGPARPASADFAGGVPGGLADNQATDVAAGQERTIGIRPDKGTTQFAVCEHVIVTVIGKTRVNELQRLHADASDELGGWYLVARKAGKRHGRI